MINLTSQEKEKLMLLSKDFVEIHQGIMKVDETIREMESKASSLISQLDACRNNEFRFVSELSDKYGEGSLNPFTLTWEIKKEKEIV